MKNKFYKTGELNGFSFFKFPFRSNAVLNVGNDDKFCFLWSKLASLHPCKNDHPDSFPNYKYYFDKLNIDGFDCSNGFKCSGMRRFEKFNNSFINMFELSFYQDQNNRKQRLIHIEKM